MDRATEGILDVARSVLADLDPDTVLERVLESAQELTEARYAALGVLNESKTELARFLTRTGEINLHSDDFNWHSVRPPCDREFII